MIVRGTELKSRLGYAEYPKRRLLHVLDTNKIDSMSVFALELIQLMPEYHHTVWAYADPSTMDITWMLAMQAAGANLLHTDNRTHTDGNHYGACIFYDTAVHSSIDRPGDIPIIYYQYHNDPYFQPDVLIHAGMYPEGDYVDVAMPPAIRSRVFASTGRQRSGDMFSVGIFSSGRKDKYPADLIKYFMDNIPDDMRLIHTAIKDGPKPARNKPNVWMVPLMMDAVLKGLTMSDVSIYAHGPNYTTKWGRLCFELLSSGKPMICERRGAPVRLLKDKVHTLFFDTPEEALQLVKMLRQSPDVGGQLGANGRMLAGWQDIATHLGTLKTVLRAVGT